MEESIMKISESEMEIMKLLWKHEGAVTTAELLRELNNSWKTTTVITFLKRLNAKGMVGIRREGNTNYYKAVVSEEEYKSEQTEEFMQELHGGSVESFLSAFYGRKKPDKKEMEEIRKWFEEL